MKAGRLLRKNSSQSQWGVCVTRVRQAKSTHGGAMPMACRLARATRLCEPVPSVPRMPGFMANCDWMRACSSAALRAFSMASFMNVAACEGGMDCEEARGGFAAGRRRLAAEESV